MICELLFKVNFVAALKGKTLFVCRVYKSIDDPFMGVCGIPPDLFLSDFSHSSIIQFLFVKVF